MLRLRVARDSQASGFGDSKESGPQVMVETEAGADLGGSGESWDDAEEPGFASRAQGSSDRRCSLGN